MENFHDFIRKMFEENIKFIIFKIENVNLRGCCVCNQMKSEFEFPQLFKNINICNKCISNFDTKRIEYLKRIFEDVQKKYPQDDLENISLKINKKDYILMKKKPKIEVFIYGGEYESE